MGTTLAVVKSVGIVPCFNEAWKNSVGNVGYLIEVVLPLNAPICYKLNKLSHSVITSKYYMCHNHQNVKTRYDDDCYVL